MDEHNYFITPQEAAALLRVSTKTILRWALADPSMPTLRIGQTVRFPRERLLAWLRAQEQGRPGRHRSRSPVSPAARSGA